MADPLFDPTDELDAVERSIEEPSEPRALPLGPDQLHMDPIGQGLDSLERRLDGYVDFDPSYDELLNRAMRDPEAVFEHASAPSPEPAEPAASLASEAGAITSVGPSAPEGGAPAIAGPAPAGLLRPAEAERLPWVGLQPATAARPWFTWDGIGPPSHQSRGGGGAGRYKHGYSAGVRFCPEKHELVSGETCESCERYLQESGSGQTCELDHEGEEDSDYETEEI